MQKKLQQGDNYSRDLPREAHAMAQRIELWPIERLVPHANNPRHFEKQVAQIAASIAAFGLNNPILVDTRDMVIAGHTRVHAAHQLEFEEVRVIR